MKSLLDLGVTSDDRERLLRGLHEGKYNLLLGAGSSYGCKGGDSVDLKDGVTLSKQIADAFSLKLNSDEIKKLPLTYEEAESKDGAGLRRWLRERFIGCKPTWQSIIFRMHWERIWTFNIDDVLDEAFLERINQNVYGEIKTFDWKEKIVPLDATPDTQQVVHLHGRASDLNGPLDGLIFSIPEYNKATRDSQQWHACFQTHYLEDPFIVCGASLAEEVDIAEAIRTKNFSRALGFPSFIVSFDLDDGQKDRMRRYNLIPIACPLDEFFSILLAELLEYRKTADAVASRLRPGTYERFLSQFRRLDTKDTSTLAIDGTDFYGGDEPTWKDILDDLDVDFVVTDKAIEILDRGIPRFAALLHGDNVSGKSVGLLGIAHHALSRGYKPFWFRHEEGLNPEVVSDYLSQDERCVVLIDDAGNYLEAIGKLLTISKSKGQSARVFISLRSKRVRGFRIDVADEFRHEYKFGPLHKRDIVRLVQRRRRASRLGKHIGKKDSLIIKELTEYCKSELLECLSYIEFSEPIRERVRKIILSAINQPAQRDVVVRIVCVHRFGFSLPLRAALASSGLLLSEFKDILDEHLKAEGILVRDGNGLRLRHRILSEYAWMESFTEDERYQAMSSVVEALAPLVNPSTIKAKAIEHLILREVLDQDMVSRSIGGKSLLFYEQHEPSLGWSSRYWDQRALLESKVEGHFSKAYSYSQKAISLERHPFAFTSLGAICMSHAERISKSNKIEAMNYFREGEDALSEAYNLAINLGQAHEHPFVKFFASATLMFRKLDPRDTEFSSVLHLFRVWLQRAKDSPAFATSYGQKRLRALVAIEIKESLRIKRVN